MRAVDMIEMNENSNNYLFGQEREVVEKRNIQTLKRDTAETITGREDILKELKEFYNELYTSK